MRVIVDTGVVYVKQTQWQTDTSLVNVTSQIQYMCSTV